MDADVPYMMSSKNVAAILDKIQNAGAPNVFGIDFLKDLGFTSSNDRGIIKVLKFLGFLDASGRPQVAEKELCRKLLATATERGIFGFAEAGGAYSGFDHGIWATREMVDTIQSTKITPRPGKAIPKNRTDAFLAALSQGAVVVTNDTGINRRPDDRQSSTRNRSSRVRSNEAAHHYRNSQRVGSSTGTQGLREAAGSA